MTAVLRTSQNRSRWIVELGQSTRRNGRGHVAWWNRPHDCPCLLAPLGWPGHECRFRDIVRHREVDAAQQLNPFGNGVD